MMQPACHAENLSEEWPMDQQERMLRSLGTSSLSLKKPVPITVKKTGPSNYVAQAHSLRLLLAAPGKTRSGAMRKLAGGIARQYWLLASEPVENRAPLQTNLLCFLRKFIKENEQINDTEGACG